MVLCDRTVLCKDDGKKKRCRLIDDATEGGQKSLSQLAHRPTDLDAWVAQLRAIPNSALIPVPFQTSQRPTNNIPLTPPRLGCRSLRNRHQHLANQSCLVAVHNSWAAHSAQ